MRAGYVLTRRPHPTTPRNALCAMFVARRNRKHRFGRESDFVSKHANITCRREGVSLFPSPPPPPAPSAPRFGGWSIQKRNRGAIKVIIHFELPWVSLARISRHPVSASVLLWIFCLHAFFSDILFFLLHYRICVHISCTSCIIFFLRYREFLFSSRMCTCELLLLLAVFYIFTCYFDLMSLGMYLHEINRGYWNIIVVITVYIRYKMSKSLENHSLWEIRVRK